MKEAREAGFLIVTVKFSIVFLALGCIASLLPWAWLLLGCWS